MRTISTGEPSTLETYRKIAVILFEEGSPAVAFLDKKAAACANGLQEEVIVDETQVLQLLARLHFKE